MAQPDATSETPTLLPPVTDVVQGLNLSPEVLHLAPWRKLPPLRVPAYTTFDLDACCDRLARVRRVEYSTADWSQAKIRWGLSLEEAIFWVVAAGRWCKTHDANPQIVAAVRKLQFPDVATLEFARAQFAERQRELPAELAVALARILGPAQFLEVLIDGFLQPNPAGSNPWMLRQDIPLYRGFWEFVLPYLDSAQLDSVREAVKPKLDPAIWPKGHYDGIPRPYYVAGILGMSRQLEDLVRTWPQAGPKDYGKFWHITSNNPLLVLYGLDSPTLIESVVRGYQIRFENLFDLRGWLATTGISGLDYAGTAIQQRDPIWQGALSEEYCIVTDPAVAPHVLNLKLNGQFPATARQWLNRNVGSAVSGLLSTAAGRGRVADAALDYLRDLTKTGLGWVIEREFASATPEVVARIRRVVLERPERTVEPLLPGQEPEWLVNALKQTRETSETLPEWLNLATMPPILIDGQRLSEEHVSLMLRKMKASSAHESPQLGNAIAAGADPGSCDRFSVMLFNRWIAERNPNTDIWVMSAVGWLGGDATVAAIIPKLKRWPGGASIKRIKDGLKAIRRIGTDYALAQLGSLTKSVGNPRLRSYALHEFLEAASERQLTVEQLEDRTIPTLGLDRPDSSETILDYGPRQFRAAVAADLRLLACDERGKGFLVLPTPRKSDDAIKVAEARAAWKLSKKQFELVMSGVCKRMEQALIAQRRWSAREFDAHLVRHPISGAVARRLLWGRFDPSTRQLAVAFRISAEGEFVSAEDRPLPEDDRPIGLIHPVQLPAGDRATWCERLADYEIVPPFPQLERPLFVLTDAERGATEFTRFNRKDLNRNIVATLPAFSGWMWESHAATRTFAEHGLKARVRTQGYHPMELQGVSFVASSHTHRMAAPDSLRPLGSIDPVVLCEALADVRAFSGASPDHLHLTGHRV